MPIAARSAEIWFTTNTAFQPKKERALGKKNMSKGKKGPESIDALTEYLREGVRKLLQVAVETELEEFLEQWKLVRDLKGRKAVVKNGYNLERSIAAKFPFWDPPDFTVGNHPIS